MSATITQEAISRYSAYLRGEECSEETVKKYTRYALRFSRWLGELELSKNAVITFKEELSVHYTAAGANGVIAAVNSLLKFLQRSELQARAFKIQRQLFSAPERELSSEEANCFIRAATALGRERSALFVRTMLATGIRVSELQYITVEAAKLGRAEVRLKGKVREIVIADELCRQLIGYAKRRSIMSGSIFITRSGKPLDRSYIWKEMKILAAHADVVPSKVYPHALRHCFARTYYTKYSNLAELADILGHSSVETTRIYTATTLESCRTKINSLGLAA